MCDWVTTTGQCPHPAMPGSRFCEAHNPRSEDLKLDQYLLSKRLLGDSPARHAAADEVKSLRTEIAILRAFVEKRINMMETDAEFVSAMSQMKDTFLAIEKLVSSCHNMEVKLGSLLSKTSLMSLAQKIIHIIDQNLAEVPGHEELVEKIGIEIAEAIAKQENE